MQENRSFDHAFGTLRGVRGFNDPRAVTLPDQKPVWLQTNAAGETYAPFRLDFKGTRATWLGSLPHSWRDQAGARNHGNHDGWLEAKRSGHEGCEDMPLTMGYYDREDLPFYYALADAFTICDQHFCSSLTATTPNRLHLWTGTIREKADAASAPNVRNSDVDYGSTASWKTFPERLEAAGISWRIYQNEVSVPSGLEGEADAWLANFTDNPLEWFEQYNVGSRKIHREYVERAAITLPEEIEKLRAEGGSDKELRGRKSFCGMSSRSGPDGPRRRSRSFRSANGVSMTRRSRPTRRIPATASCRRSATAMGAWSARWPFRRPIPCTGSAKTSKPESYRRSRGWCRPRILGPSRIAVVWRLVRRRNAEHPDQEPGSLEQDDLHPHLRRERRLLRPCSAVLAPDPASRNPARHRRGSTRAWSIFRSSRIGSGIRRRKRAAVRSGWATACRSSSLRRGVAADMFARRCSTTPRFCSSRRVAGRLSQTEIREPNISAWRRTVCGDLTSAFRAFQGSPAAVPFLPRDTFFEQVHRAQFERMPSGYRKLSAEDVAQFENDRLGVRWMPQQEPGVRPSSALPYELAASGAVRARQALEDRTRGPQRPSGRPPWARRSCVHTRDIPGSKEPADARLHGCRRTTPGGFVGSEGCEKGVYHLRVGGPNGFLREFAGSAEDPRVEIQCEYARDKGVLTGDVETARH